MTDIPRLNGVIAALEAGQPTFTAFATPDVPTAVAFSTSSDYDGIVFEMEHNAWDSLVLRDCLQYMLNRGQIAKSGSLAPTVTPMVRVPPNGNEMAQWQAKQALDLGVYGVVYQSTSTRRREMAVRMALGAGRAEVRRMVLREGLQLGAIGLILGVMLALALTRFLSGVLFEIQAYDPVTFAGVGAFLLSSILLASYFPARRASRVEPNTVLRYE